METKIHRAAAWDESSRELRQLYRELVPSSFEKCVQTNDCYRWNNDIQHNILDASAKLTELVAIKLTHTEMTEDVEEDTVQLLLALCGVFDKDAHFHRKHVHSKLSRNLANEVRNEVWRET